MFTGIVEEMGEVVAATPNSLRIAGGAAMDALAVSDSIAVNGVCLTVTARDGSAFAVDVVEETLARTNLGVLRPGDPVEPGARAHAGIPHGRSHRAGAHRRLRRGDGGRRSARE